MGVNKHNYIAMGKAAGKKGKTFTLYPFPFSLTKRYILRFNCANLLISRWSIPHCPAIHPSTVPVPRYSVGLLSELAKFCRDVANNVSTSSTKCFLGNFFTVSLAKHHKTGVTPLRAKMIYYAK